MRTRTLIVLGCLFLPILPPGLAHAVEAAREEELINLADHAAQVAEEFLAGPQKDESLDNWVARRPLDLSLGSRMKQIWYDDKSVAGLAKAIKTRRKGPAVDLYVLNHLVKPLLMAKTEVVRKALPAIAAVRKPSTEYAKLPAYTERQLKGFESIEKASPKDKAKLKERRLQKMKKELAIAFHNEQLGRFNKGLYYLTVYADQEQKDRELIAMIVSTERRRGWDYTVILEAFRSEARRMSQDRAGRLYHELKPIWHSLREQGAKTYEDATAAQLKITGNSTNTMRKDSAGNRLLKAINQMAPIAKLPALQNPKPRKSRGKPKVDRTRKKTR